MRCQTYNNRGPQGQIPGLKNLPNKSFPCSSVKTVTKNSVHTHLNGEDLSLVCNHSLFYTVDTVNVKLVNWSGESEILNTKILNRWICRQKKKKNILFECQSISHESTNWWHYFYVSYWRRDRHFTWSSEPREGLAACSAKGLPSFLSYFRALSINTAQGIEPATFRSAAKRSADWANPAAVEKRFDLNSF